MGMINETNTNQLSEREREVLQLVAAGQSNQQIANTLGISINTVKVHLRNVFGKIGVASRTEATLYAVRSGIVTVEGTTLDRGEVADDVAAAPQNVEQVVLDDAPGLVAEPQVSQNAVRDFSEADAPSREPFPVREGAAASVSASEAVPVPIPSTQPQSRAGGISRPLLAVAVGTLALIVIGALVALRSGSAATPPQSTIAANEPTRWTVLRSLPAARAAFAATEIAGQVYVIGGENQTGVLDVVERFDVRNESWSELSRKPTSVTDVRGAALGGKIYVPGGRRSNDPTDITDAFERYDPRSEQWETLPNLPAPRSAYALAAVEGKLYLFGGWDGSEYRPEVFVYDPDQNVWDEGTPMKTPRGYADAAVVEGSVYVIGGESASGESLRLNEVYTPAAEGQGPWSSKTPLPEPRSRFGAAVALRTIHVMGGDPNAAPLKYNVALDNWEPFEESPTPVGTQPGVVQQEGRLLILGGASGGVYSDVMQAYQALYNNVLTVPQQ